MGCSRLQRKHTTNTGWTSKVEAESRIDAGTPHATWTGGKSEFRRSEFGLGHVILHVLVSRTTFQTAAFPHQFETASNTRPPRHHRPVRQKRARCLSSLPLSTSSSSTFSVSLTPTLRVLVRIYARLLFPESARIRDGFRTMELRADDGQQIGRSPRARS